MEPPENGEVRDILDSRRMRRWLIGHIKPILIWGGGSMVAVAALRDQIESVLHLITATITGGGAS